MNPIETAFALFVNTSPPSLIAALVTEAGTGNTFVEVLNDDGGWDVMPPGTVLSHPPPGCVS